MNQTGLADAVIVSTCLNMTQNQKLLWFSHRCLRTHSSTEVQDRGATDPTLRGLDLILVPLMRVCDSGPQEGPHSSGPEEGPHSSGTTGGSSQLWTRGGSSQLWDQRRVLTALGPQEGPHSSGTTGGSSQLWDHRRVLTALGPQEGPHSSGPEERPHSSGTTGGSSQLWTRGASSSGTTSDSPDKEPDLQVL